MKNKKSIPFLLIGCLCISYGCIKEEQQKGITTSAPKNKNIPKPADKPIKIENKSYDLPTKNKNAPINRANIEKEKPEDIYATLREHFLEALKNKDAIALEQVLKEEEYFVKNKKLKNYQLVDEKYQKDYPLLFCSSQQFIPCVSILLKYKANQNVQNKEGYSALIIATISNNVELVKILAPTVDLNLELSKAEGGNAIYWAYKKQYFEITSILEKAGAVHPEKKEVLLQAALNNDFQTVKAALASNINPNIYNEAGDSALILAAAGGHLEIAQTMLRKKASINYQDKDGYSALLASTWKGENKLSLYLLDNKADVHLKHNSERTALMFAAWKCSPKVVEAILKKSATNINAQDRDEWTALMFAAFKGNIENVKLLLKYKADREIHNKDGLTALDLAEKKNFSEVIALLE